MTGHTLFPWGVGGTLPLTMPETWGQPEVCRADVSGPIGDYPAALSAAIDRPEGQPPLESLIEPGEPVAIVVDDPSRWTPVREALPIVLERLHAAGVRDQDLSISVGVGRHLAVDSAAMRKRLGDAVVDRYACHSPPVDDLTQYDSFGTTDDGIDVRVFRPVARARLRILIGSVLPHLQAGFGGGYKLIFPGCSHRTTLVALHGMGLGRGFQAGALLGKNADGNPMRSAIRKAAARLPGHYLSISHLLGPPGTILRVCSGHPDAVQDRLAAEARQRFQAPERPPADLIIAGNHPWPGDPMQSFKVLLQHQNAARPGGVLVGFFWTDPDEIDRSMPMGWLRAIAATGAPGGRLIRHGLKAADLAAGALGMRSGFMIRWARELVADRQVFVYAPPLFDRIGPRLGPVRLFGDQAPLWASVAKALRSCPSPTIRAFPEGGLTYCPVAGEPTGQSPRVESGDRSSGLQGDL